MILYFCSILFKFLDSVNNPDTLWKSPSFKYKNIFGALYKRKSQQNRLEAFNYWR